MGLILHQFADSPFAEKIRRLLALRQLQWQAVDVPMVLPKPDLVALTGGYRRTPVLQIGADIVCDTALIARVLDGLSATETVPLLHDGPPLLTDALLRWAETDLFTAAMGWCFQPAGAAVLFNGWSDEQRAALLADRQKMREGGAVLRMNGQDAATALAHGLARLAAQLADGRAWLLGDQPTIVDLAVWPSLWSIRRLPPVAGVLDPWPAVLAWMDRLEARAPLPQVRTTALTSAEAITCAVEATPDPTVVTRALARVATDPASGWRAGLADRVPAFAVGETIRVMPNDSGFDPVEGPLMACGADHVAVQRDDPRAGRVVVHFPRRGYTIRAVRAAR